MAIGSGTKVRYYFVLNVVMVINISMTVFSFIMQIILFNSKNT